MTFYKEILAVKYRPLKLLLQEIKSSNLTKIWQLEISCEPSAKSSISGITGWPTSPKHYDQGDLKDGSWQNIRYRLSLSSEESP